MSKYREKGKGEKGKIKRKETDRGRELKKKKDCVWQREIAQNKETERDNW